MRFSSRTLPRHLGRLVLLACRISRRPMSTISHPKNAPRVSSTSLQHFRTQGPFFSLHRPMKRLENVALLPRSPVLRVWLPSLRCQPLKSLEASFSPQRSWDSPFRALLLLHDQVHFPSEPSPLLRFLRKPSGFLPALQRLPPMKKAVPLFAPRRISPGRDLCSLELSGLSGSLVLCPKSRASPSSFAPLVLR